MVSINIPYSDESRDGVLQYMKVHNKEKNIFLKHSPLHKATNNAECVLTLDNKTYITQNNTDLSMNFLIIQLLDRTLLTKGYVIRSDARTSDIYYLRSWKLYGSLIGSDWTQIHEVSEKDDLKQGAFGRYSIVGRTYRFFKIVQTGPCLGTSQEIKNRLRLSYIDGRTCKTKSIHLLASISFLLVLI